MAAPVRDEEWLAWVEKLMVGRREAPEARDRFRCLLDEQPNHLVPERLLRQLRRDRGDLHLNAECTLAASGSPNQVPWSDAFAPALQDGSVAWIRDPGTGVRSPYWLGWELSRWLQSVRENLANIDELPPAVRTRFCDGGILVPHQYPEQRKERWRKTVETCGNRFREHGYAAISGLVPAFHLAEMRRYYRRKIRRGAVVLGDDQSARRYIAHNEPVAVFFHRQLAGAVSELVGQAVKPSYAYMASYQGGAGLERHTDRAQCEFSITMCIDYAPEPADSTQWPLYLDTEGGTVTVYQALGDGLLYRGRELPHYRRTLAEGHSSTSIFFHYVAADFAGSLD